MSESFFSLRDGDEELVDSVNDKLTEACNDDFYDIEYLQNFLTKADSILREHGLSLDGSDLDGKAPEGKDLDKLKTEVEELEDGEVVELVLPVLDSSNEQSEYNLVVRYGAEADSDGDIAYILDMELAYVWETQELYDAMDSEEPEDE